MSQFYHRDIPQFYRHKSSFVGPDFSLTLYLELDKKDHVKGLFYEFDGDDSKAHELSDFAKEIEARPFESVDFRQSDHTYMPSYYYKLFVDEIKGRTFDFATQKNVDPLNLICRCFGVYKEDIHELVGRGVELKGLRDLGDHLNAGVGCGSCHHDLIAELTPLLSAPIEEVTPKESIEMPLWQKLDSQSLARQIFQVIKDFNDNNSIAAKAKLLGTRPTGALIKVEANDFEQATQSLDSAIVSSLGKGLEVKFS